MEEAEYLCDRVAIIDKGEILVVDTIDDLKDRVGQDLITLTCSECAAFEKQLNKESWVTSVTKKEKGLRLSVEKGEEKIPHLIEIAGSHKVTITSINLRKPTLDDVFLHYTGREMRDQDAENPMKMAARMHGRR
jgi:ABC-2 type transport system ATP-binding protein